MFLRCFLTGETKALKALNYCIYYNYLLNIECFAEIATNLGANCAYCSNQTANEQGLCADKYLLLGLS